jgi:hypothetical protein
MFFSLKNCKSSLSGLAGIDPCLILYDSNYNEESHYLLFSFSYIEKSLSIAAIIRIFTWIVRRVF